MKESSSIVIADLEVHYCVGVTDQERSQPQRLLLTIEMAADFSSAAASDRIEETINYQAVVDDLLRFGQERSWKLIEKLAADVAESVLAKYQPDSVRVEVKKFIIPQTRYVAVNLARTRAV
ncbi:MAG TPA: dihydroneopterin aldolase [Clostridia bacterium]|nr:dihydroneopterin aldolase [Clostridia bacterium]